MLGMHDRAKADLGYQRDCPQQIVGFRPGATWLCLFPTRSCTRRYQGHYMLEQTIHLAGRALYDPESSPLAILERLCGDVCFRA